MRKHRYLIFFFFFIILSGFVRADILDNAGEKITLGEPDRARIMVKEYLKSNPDSARAYYILFLADRKSGDNEKAQANLERAIGFDPKNPLYLNEMAEFLYNQGNIRSALEYYLEIENAGANSFNLYYRISQIYLSLNQSAPASNYARKAINTESSNYLGWQIMGRIQEKLGNSETAGKNYNESVRLGDNTPETLYAFGRIVKCINKSRVDV